LLRLKAGSGVESPARPVASVERVWRSLMLAVALLVARTGIATAHTGDDATFKHVLIEFTLWGLGFGGALALLVAVFWVRARLLRRSG